MRITARVKNGPLNRGHTWAGKTASQSIEIANPRRGPIAKRPLMSSGSHSNAHW